jgi:hypothetical protein
MILSNVPSVVIKSYNLSCRHPKSELRQITTSSSDIFRRLGFSIFTSLATITTCVIGTIDMARNAMKWTSWADIHSQASQIEIVHDLDANDLTRVNLELLWWSAPIYSIVLLSLLFSWNDVRDAVASCSGGGQDENLFSNSSPSS